MSDIPIRELKGHDILSVERFRDSTCRMIEFCVRKQTALTAAPVMKYACF